MVSSIRFRLHYSISRLRLPDSRRYLFNFGGDLNATVALTAELTDDGYPSSKTRSIAEGIAEPSKRAEEDLQRLSAGSLFDPNANYGATEYVGPDGTIIRTPPLSNCPGTLREFFGPVLEELRQHTRRTVSAFRWRLNEPGSHDPLSFVGLNWSRDGEFWHVVPYDFDWDLEVVQSVVITPEVMNDVHAVASGGGAEPIYHEMIREARLHARHSPRSALMIGIAAGELAVKTCIGCLVPNAAWLALHAPTPPLNSMMTDYLPTLPAKNLIDGKVKPPPKAILDTLKKGVLLRNAAAHAGSAPPPMLKIAEILDAVTDLAWLCDYYSGATWALSYLKNPTRIALGLPEIEDPKVSVVLDPSEAHPGKI